jgi:hypothetical protein
MLNAAICGAVVVERSLIFGSFTGASALDP